MKQPTGQGVAKQALNRLALALAVAISAGAAFRTVCAATPAVPGAIRGTAADIVQQPRPFGYVLGDMLTQRVLLQSAGRTFDPSSLPPTERAGLWLSRRSAAVLSTEDGHRWLVIEYQLINAPQQLMVVNLPELTLKSRTGATTLSVPEWPISVAPLTPRAAFAKGGLQDLRPDHAAPKLATASLQRQLELWSGALAVSLFVWLVWWWLRNLRAAKKQPFAQAWRVIKQDNADLPQSWMALHRAFDQTAGSVLQLSTLPVLFTQARQFEAQRAEIERFYAESTRRFFGVAAIGPAAAALFPLRTFCATLRQIEKRHER